MNEPRNAVMLNRFTRTDSLGKRKDDSRGSPVMEESLAPIWSRKLIPSAFIGPKASTATETKMGGVWWRHTSFFPYGRCLSSRTSVWGWWCEIGCCESVLHCGVPRQTPAVLAWNEGKANGAFPVVCKQPSWFFWGSNVKFFLFAHQHEACRLEN